MSILTRDIAPQAEQESKGSLMGQSIRSGLLQAGAGLSGLAATGAEAVGDGINNIRRIAGHYTGEPAVPMDARAMAQPLYDKSADLRAQGNALAPEISSYKQVNDVDSALRYGVGLAGQGLPAIGAGLLGAAVSRNPLAGATMAAAPFMAGDLAVRQQEDPEIAKLSATQRLLQAGGAGTLNSAMSNAIPLAMVGKLGGNGIRAAMSMPKNIATNVGEAVGGNAVAGYAGEAINQDSLTALNANRDKSMDEQMRMEGAVGGGVIGAPFAAAGIAGQAMHGKKPVARTDGVQIDIPAPAPKLSPIDRIKGAFKKDDAAVEMDTAERMAQNQDLVDKTEWAGATPERKGQMLSESDKTFTEKATEWGKKLYEDADLKPETRAKIDEFMANPMDRTKAAEVAKVFKENTTVKQAVQKTREFGDSISKKFDEFVGGDKVQDVKETAGVKLDEAQGVMGKAGTKAKEFYDSMTQKYADVTKGKTNSEEFSPKLHSAMADAIAPSLGQRFPDLVQNDTHMRVVTGTLRRTMAMMQATGKLDADTIDGLHGWFGDDTPSVLASLHSAVLDGGDKAAEANYFGAINKMVDETANTNSLEGVLRASMPDMQDAAPGAFKELIAGFRDHFDGNDAKGKTKEQMEFRTREIDAAARAQFGDKADTVLKAFEKDAKRRFESNKEEVVDDVNAEGMQETDAADVAEPTQYLGAGKDKATPQLVRSPEAHRAEFGSKSQAERLIEEARMSNPDRMVDFVKVKDLPADMRAKYPDAGPDDGLVLVEGARDETRMTRDEFKQVRVNTKNNAHVVNNKSIIDTGVKGAVIDARKLVKLMKSKLDYSAADDHGSRSRTARAFMEGIAALQDAMGKTFDIPDTVELAPGFTYKQAQEANLSQRKPDPAWMKGKTDEEINKSLMRADALKELSDKELNVATGKMEEIVEARESAFAAKIKELRDAGTKLDKAGYRELRKEMGVDSAKEAARAADREAAARVEAKNKVEVLDKEGRTEVDPNEQITRVGNNEPRKVGLDDNALQYDNFISPTKDGSTPAAVAGGIESRISWLQNVKTQDGRKNMLAERVGKMARGLLANMDKLSAEDKAMLTSIVKDESVKSINETVTPMYAKYKDVLEAQARRFDTDSATKRQISEIAKGINLSSGTLMAKYAKMREQYAGKSDAVFTRALAADLNVSVSKIEGLNALYRTAKDRSDMRGPNPEVEAAKAEYAKNGYKSKKDLAKEQTAMTAERLAERDRATRSARSTDDWLAQQGKEQARIRRMSTEHLQEQYDAWYAAEKKAMREYDPNDDGGASVFGQEPDHIKDISYELARRKSVKKLNAFTSKVLGEGDLAPTLKAIKTSDDAMAVQRAVDSLADHLGNPRAREVHEAAVARIEALIDKDPDVTLRMQNKQRTGSAKINAKDQADIKAHIDKVLGPTVEVEFAKMLHAGEFVRDANRKAAGLVEDVIRISVHAMDPMGTAFHESMHAFIQKLRDVSDDHRVHPLFKAADSAFVRTKLAELLANEPDALKQIADSAEERVAYMYQFWAAGKLNLPVKPRTVMEHIQHMIHKIAGTWTNDQRATHIMEYFNDGRYARDSGDPSVVRRALREGSQSRFDDVKGFHRPLMKIADTVLATGNGRLRGTGIEAFVKLADKIYAPLQGESGDPGYIPAARVKQDQTMNTLAEKLRGFTPEQIMDAHNARINGKMGDTPEARIINRHVQAMLKEMKGYMREAGVRMGDLGDDYYPRIWDAELVTKNEPAFRAMIKKYQDSGEYAGNPERLIAKFVRGENGDDLFETVRPGMQHTKVRKLDFITPEDAAPFVERDMFRTAQSYVAQATRRAEWSRRFNDDNSGLDAIMLEAKDQGATPEHEALVADYLKAMDGTLGDTIDPKWRKAFGHMIVYQNVRLLPLMIFSSLIDPGGVVVRGGTVRDAFKTLKRGLSEIPKGFKKEAVHDEWTQLATMMGVIEDSVLIKSLGSSYAQGMSNNTGRKVNDTFFKYNLMAQFNTSMRVGATEAAVGFMAKHADGKASTHSARWMAELGFKPGEMIVKDGRPLMTQAEFKAHGMTDAQAQTASDRMAIALNKWVDGAILRPNAAHKPIWMNDPRFALFSHLKQFVYSFQETILKRVINEARHGNAGPAYALAAYVPFMIAADVMKGMLVSGGGVPDDRKNWDLVDYVGYGTQRAGLFGVSQIGIDIAKDVHRGGVGLGAVAGPTLEQLGDAVSVVAGPQQFETFAMNSLPANQVFDAVGEAADD